ncbi:hypothetical protein KFZ76_19775 [Methylovulum psychrotolerans]|uniref:hypothetical protein n=1 Tax=Methylovulum psychrotolerans TaxID=1704499 RepID=UPI001BFF103B|nr:hypothetical protein [Methylovulum psychrotolerans]MBT9099942.1 hypothetical protein [Methylovulum psychrotolerans]
MAIPLASSFQRGSALPLDLYSLRADLAARDAIPLAARFEFMVCTVAADGKTYRLEGGTANSHWVEAAASAAWGSIGGTLAAQTDVQAALNAKEPLIAAGTVSGYVQKMGTDVWTDSPSQWDGTKYAGVTVPLSLVVSGGWAVSWRPTRVKVTLTITSLQTFTNLNFYVYSTGSYFQGDWRTPDLGNNGLPPLVLGVNVLELDLTGLEFDILELVLSPNFNYPTYDVTDVEFFISANQYLGGDKVFHDLNTGVVPEAGNLYFTVQRALNSVLTGFYSSPGTVADTDTLLQAVQKLDGNINAMARVVITYTSSVTLYSSNLPSGSIVRFNGTAAMTATIVNSTPAGWYCYVYQANTGQVTFTVSGGALHNVAGFTKTAGRYAQVMLFCDSNAGFAPQIILSGSGA